MKWYLLYFVLAASVMLTVSSCSEDDSPEVPVDGVEVTACDELQMFQNYIVMTDDGSVGKQGVVTVGVEEVINRETVNKCITIGPAIMMKFVALTTAKYNIPTEASLNTIMVDGTGMCGACRVTVGGKTKFVCVDGPEFDAHEVDWTEMLSRMKSYKAEEAAAPAVEEAAAESTTEAVTE